MHIVCMNHSLNAHSASLAKYEERFVHIHFLFLNVHTVSEKKKKVTKLPRLCAVKPKFAHYRHT